MKKPLIVLISVLFVVVVIIAFLMINKHMNEVTSKLYLFDNAMAELIEGFESDNGDPYCLYYQQGSKWLSYGIKDSQQISNQSQNMTSEDFNEHDIYQTIISFVDSSSYDSYYIKQQDAFCKTLNLNEFTNVSYYNFHGVTKTEHETIESEDDM